MLRTSVIVGALLLGTMIPFGAHAATFQTDHFLTLSSSTPDNTYLAGGDVRVQAPLPADLIAAGGTVTVTAPIGGDALLAGGTVDVQRPVAGDLRAAGAHVSVSGNVSGDIAAVGGIVTVSGTATDMHIAGGTVQVTNGSQGPVTIYGMDVSLSGTFNGNVEVTASDRFTISPGTVIHGVLKYNAPQQAEIPAAAHIDNGVDYVGSAAFLPTVQQAKTFALAGLWVFFLVRIIAAVIATGLIAGLFPLLAARVVEQATTRTIERTALLALLGFAAMIAVPVLILVLVVSFVGIGLALILGSAYALFLLLSYAYAGVITAGLLLRLFKKNVVLTWQFAILGMLIFWLLGSIPVIGLVIRIVLMGLAGGTLLMLFYGFAFRPRLTGLDS
jgi:hypothetical protein